MEWFSIDAPRAYFGYLQELLFSLYEYFSLSLLTRTLFAPFRHDAVALADIPVSAWGQAIILNLVSRTMGAAIRLAVVAAGFLTLFVVAVGAVLFLVGWFMLPLVLSASFFEGIYLLMRGGL